MNQQIIMKFAVGQEPVIEVKNVPGQGCYAAAKAVTDAMGAVVTSSTPTAEAQQTVVSVGAAAGVNVGQ